MYCFTMRNTKNKKKSQGQKEKNKNITLYAIDEPIGTKIFPR
jgi:hypothetical protein